MLSATATANRDPYRDGLDATVQRLGHLAAARRDDERQALPLARVYARRAARTAAGATAVALGLTVFAGALAAIVRGNVDADGDGLLTRLLLLAWPVAAFAYALTRLSASVGLGWRVRAAGRTGAEPYRAVAQLERAAPPRALAADRAAALETWSVALPLAGLAFLLPLTLHYFVSPLLGSDGPQKYDSWIRMSVMIVGHAHVALALLCVRFARRLHRAADVEQVRADGWKAYGLTVLVAAIPGVMLFALPPAITALTGLLFVPWMFEWARRRVATERLVLEGLYS